MRNRRVVTVLVSLAVLFGIAWLLQPAVPDASQPTGSGPVIAFGDSLVEGRGATTGHDLVSVLSQRLGVSIVNAGRSGDTTGTALSRLERDVLSHSPRIVIVLLGGNDFLRRVPIEDVFTNLATIVGRIRERGSAVVLVAVGVGLFSDPYRDEYESLARRLGAGLVPDVLDGIIGHANLMADAIHPNDKGYVIMADRLEPVLRDLVRVE